MGFEISFAITGILWNSRFDLIRQGLGLRFEACDLNLSYQRLGFGIGIQFAICRHWSLGIFVWCDMHFNFTCRCNSVVVCVKMWQNELQAYSVVCTGYCCVWQICAFAEVNVT